MTKFDSARSRQGMLINSYAGARDLDDSEYDGERIRPASLTAFICIQHLRIRSDITT